mmetsp:Transcript_43082/g.99807  ORF Transcript_43082/g.99807 Transcript_43082/m.99807 type:complete len:93 (-) Transcript_43082:179-457(-)
MSWRNYPYNRLTEMFRKPSFAGGPAPLTDSGLDLLSAMLTYDPERRISAKDALAHPYFSEDPQPMPDSLMASAFKDAFRARRSSRPAPPSSP